MEGRWATMHPHNSYSLSTVLDSSLIWGYLYRRPIGGCSSNHLIIIIDMITLINHLASSSATNGQMYYRGEKQVSSFPLKSVSKNLRNYSLFAYSVQTAYL